jgi:hypothetical protein
MARIESSGGLFVNAVILASRETFGSFELVIYFYV